MAGAAGGITLSVAVAAELILGLGERISTVVKLKMANNKYKKEFYREIYVGTVL